VRIQRADHCGFRGTSTFHRLGDDTNIIGHPTPSDKFSESHGDGGVGCNSSGSWIYHYATLSMALKYTPIPRIVEFRRTNILMHPLGTISDLIWVRMNWHYCILESIIQESTLLDCHCHFLESTRVPFWIVTAISSSKLGFGYLYNEGKAQLVAQHGVLCETCSFVIVCSLLRSFADPTNPSSLSRGAEKD
jgi:hypothetical protein